MFLFSLEYVLVLLSKNVKLCIFFSPNSIIKYLFKNAKVVRLNHQKSVILLEIHETEWNSNPLKLIWSNLTGRQIVLHKINASFRSNLTWWQIVLHKKTANSEWNRPSCRSGCYLLKENDNYMRDPHMEPCVAYYKTIQLVLFI